MVVILYQKLWPLEGYRNPRTLLMGPISFALLSLQWWFIRKPSLVLRPLVCTRNSSTSLLRYPCYLFYGICLYLEWLDSDLIITVWVIDFCRVMYCYQIISIFTVRMKWTHRGAHERCDKYEDLNNLRAYCFLLSHGRLLSLPSGFYPVDSIHRPQRILPSRTSRNIPSRICGSYYLGNNSDMLEWFCNRPC